MKKGGTRVVYGTVGEAARIEEEMRLLHPVGRVGRPEEVAAVVAHLLSTTRASSTVQPCRSTAGGRCSRAIPRRTILGRKNG
jgi:NAD(P)-dependent dehydrogenase (short-subunit alcohol dehydrogenase family)